MKFPPMSTSKVAASSATMHRVERRQDQDIGPNRHALRVCCNIAREGRNLQHLHRMGQPVMWKPQRRETGLTRADLLDHLRTRLEGRNPPEIAC